LEGGGQHQLDGALHQVDDDHLAVPGPLEGGGLLLGVVEGATLVSSSCCGALTQVDGALRQVGDGHLV
jgi:hypothetical protein